MVHAHVWHMRHVSARAHLARTVSAGSREASYGGGGRGSAPKFGRHRAAAAGGDSREHRATCEGRSGRLGCARLAIGSTRERAEAALRPPVRLWGRG
jgi:hypothetical protein